MSQQIVDPIIFVAPKDAEPASRITLSERALRGNEALWGQLRLIPPESTEVSTKERIAINRALEVAYNSKDPVRWLLVKTRGELLQMSSKQYAPELGLAPHSLITKEKKGGGEVAASTYSPFFQDWAKRAKEDPVRGTEFARMYKFLMFHLLREDYFGVAGLVRQWQCHVGAPEFAKRTGIDPKIIHNHKKLGFNPSFGELVDISKKAGLLSTKKLAELWRDPTVVQARRCFVSESIKRGRALSTVLVRCAMELVAESATDDAMHRSFPLLSQKERRSVLNYEVLEAKTYSRLVSELVKRGVLDKDEGMRLAEIRAKESKRPQSRGVEKSVKVLNKKMREQGFDSTVLRNLLGELPVSDREALSHIRAALNSPGESSRVTPFGILACLVAEGKDELKEILQARRAEIRDYHRKRFGTETSPDSIERKIWGLDRGDIERAGGDVREAAREKVRGIALPALRLLLSRGVSEPREFVAQALRDLPHNDLAARASSSAPMLARIAAGETYPHLALYRRIVTAAHAALTPQSELQWFDALSRRFNPENSKSEFGQMQSRIVASIIAARGESKSALLAQHANGADAARAIRTLQRLERDRDIPIVLFKDVISSFGIEEHAPDGAAIRYLLQAKSYPRAILTWYQDGMPCATTEVREAAHRVFTSKVAAIVERLTGLPDNLPGLLSIREKRSPRYTSSGDAAIKTQDDLIVEATLTLVRVFPGASISHVEAVRGHLQKNPPKKS